VVSVGVAPSKLVAKIACALSKPDGLLVAPEEAVRWLLDPLPVRRLWGVGPVLAARLQSLGIATVGDLARSNPAKLGDRGEELVALARGEDSRPVVTDRAAKSYGEESTFEQDISAREDVTAVLTAHAEAVTRRVRRDGVRAHTVTLKIKLGRRRGVRAPRIGGEDAEPDYPLLTRSRSLGDATDDAQVVREVAIALWDAARIGEPVRLLGVTLSGLEPRGSGQIGLFDEPDRLGPALDAIRDRFGREAIHRAVADPGKITPSTRRKRGE
jgi:DNA polymerase-4